MFRLLMIAVCLPLLAQAAPRNRPTVIFVHGGAWVSGKSSEYAELAKRLEAKGLCVVLLDYALASEAKHPRPVLDLERAISGLKIRDGCDASKVYLLGHSAGAHLIAFWATEHARPEIKGFIGLEGIYDVVNLVNVWPKYEEQFITAEFGPRANWAKASPNRLPFKDKAHWLLIQSESDELVDMKQSTDFLVHLRAQGIDAKVIRLKQPSHFGVVDDLGREGDAATSALLKFL